MPYKVSTLDLIPADAKDPDGHWYGGYYGVLSFIVNTDIVANVPADWADLMKPEYNGQVALGGDPRDCQPGDPGRSLRRASRPTAAIAPRPVKPASSSSPSSTLRATSCRSTAGAAPIAQGTTPIAVAWDYNALAWQTGFEGNPQTVIVVPKTGVVGGLYAQAISAYAPHPNAAKLWMEYIYGDEGQIGCCAATVTRSASTSWSATARSRRSCSTPCPPQTPMPRRSSRPSTSRRCTRNTSLPIGMRSSEPMSTSNEAVAASSSLSGPVSTGLRPAPRGTGWRQTLNWAGALIGVAAVHHLLADVPDPAQPLSDGPGVPRPSRELHPSEHLRARPAAQIVGAFGTSICGCRRSLRCSAP